MFEIVFSLPVGMSLWVIILRQKVFWYQMLVPCAASSTPREEGGREGRRDGGTEGRRDGGTEGRREGGREGGEGGWERERGREGGEGGREREREHIDRAVMS